LIWFFINDIPVCSCMISIGVTFGNFVIILRISFWNVRNLFIVHIIWTRIMIYTSTIYAKFTSAVEDLFNISRVPAVLLRGNSTNAYISYQSLLPESLSKAWSFDTYRWIS
jgi:hypothetical protein